jgi:predicted transposase YbfD/YdcC
MAKPKPPIAHYFATLPDPRVERTRRHSLLDIIVMSILAVICDSEGWDEIADWAKDREEWLRTILELPNGIPCADTFRRVLSALDPKAFEACFRDWALALCKTTAGKLVAIDGKTVRGSLDLEKGKRALHLVNAWVADNDLIFGQVATAPMEGEYTAMAELVDLLELRGATVSIDAGGCHVEIAQKIVDKKADYLLALKANQPTMHDEVVAFFDDALKLGFGDAPHTLDESVDKGHGRLETRRTWVCSDVAWLSRGHRWPKLANIVLVEATRTVNENTSVERRTYITSAKGDAKTIGGMIRQHWGIENSVHWVLDVTFSEDASRIRRDRGPQNFALLRKLTMNMLKQEKTAKEMSIARKRRKANRSHDYLLRVLAAGLPAT